MVMLHAQTKPTIDRVASLCNDKLLNHRLWINPMSYRFEWDDNKAKSNQIEHRVTFDEACTVFDDSLARIFDDDEHSIETFHRSEAGNHPWPFCK